MPPHLYPVGSPEAIDPPAQNAAVPETLRDLVDEIAREAFRAGARERRRAVTYHDALTISAEDDAAVAATDQLAERWPGVFGEITRSPDRG